MRRLLPLMILAGCGPDKVVQEPQVHTFDEAAIRHQIELDHQKVEQIAAQFTMFMWAMGIGGVIGLAGLALVLASFAFGLGRKFVMLGFSMLLFGAIVVSVALAFPEYREQVALGAAVMAGLLLLLVVGIGVYIGTAYAKTAFQMVRGVEEAKKELAPDAVATLTSNLSKAMDEKPKQIVRSIKAKEKS